MGLNSLTRVLVVEDNPGDARLLDEMLNDQGARAISVAHADRLGDAERYLAQSHVDAILLDLGLPDAQGLEAVRRARAAAPHVPLVVLTGLDDEALAIQALQEGAQDYLVKGQIETRSLLRALRHSIERKLMSMQMAHSAEHDALTGLPNRVLLNDRIRQSIVFAQRHSKQVALLFLDLDGFKHINDSLGHSFGDKLLQSVARRLVDCGRASDTVSRQGGDEFVILLSEVQHSADAGVAARRMLQAVAEPHLIEQRELHVTTSIGVSVYPQDGGDPETLIKNADTAMYQAKADGRHSFQYFGPTMNARAVERQSIEECLRRALERHEFTLHYQPKVDVRRGTIVGAEALIRWTHPDRGVVAPGQFIPVAEDCGLILAIGHWVLREACQQARAWQDAGLPAMSMAVNVSAIEFRQESFLGGVLAILDDTGLDPSLLELELTESVLMKNAESAAIVLRALRKSGVHVAIDDFGTGYSSLSHLRKFPIDTLKIDQSFVSQITTVGDVASIVTAVINMARSLRMRVVAEGVETLEQHEFLRERECDEAQGYFFSRPVPAPQFADLLTTGFPQRPRVPPTN
jgi:diguanylate cyclase (GGDEF)-like protein